MYILFALADGPQLFLSLFEFGAAWHNSDGSSRDVRGQGVARGRRKGQCPHARWGSCRSIALLAAGSSAQKAEGRAGW